MTYAYLREINSSIELVLMINIVMTIVHYFFEGWWKNLTLRKKHEQK